MAKKSESTVTAFKAFDANLQCRGYQYEVGKTYEHSGTVNICASGFHACENPLDVLNYYPLHDSRFAVVKAAGEIQRQDGDSKLASAKIAIEAELKLPEFISAAVKWMIANVKGEGNSASGNYSNLAASGNDSNLAASGNYSKLAASGNYSKLAASGNYSNLAASGNDSNLAASGNGSNLAASGYGSKAKAGENGAIALAYFDGKRARFAVGYVGEDGIEADTWYVADAATGKLVRA